MAIQASLNHYAMNPQYKNSSLKVTVFHDILVRGVTIPENI